MNQILCLVPLGLAAWQDFRRQEIDDLFNGLLWVSVFFSGQAAIAALVFGVLVCMNRLWYWKYKMPLIEWGDVLLVPAWLGLMFFWGLLGIAAALITLSILLILGIARRRGMLLAPYLFLGYLIPVGAWIVGR